VSVVLPTRDRAGVVGRAMASVLAQTSLDLELIVVDDGSTDDTPAVLRSFRDSRVRLIRLAESRGPSRARNEGVWRSRGELVAFLDSDDEWLPEKLDRQVARLREDAHVAVVYCRDLRVDDRNGRRAPTGAALPEGDVSRMLLRGWNPAFSSVLLRRSVFLDAGGFDPELPAFTDHDLLLRIAQAGGAFAAVPDVLVVKHEYGGPQISTTPDRLLDAFARMDDKWAPVLRARVDPAAYRRWRAQLYTKALHARVREAVVRGRRLSALSWAGAACRFGPWAAQSVASSVALATLGATGYAALLRVTDGATRLLRRRAWRPFAHRTHVRR
jgi:glycosyltransferase involved in cell wall biosynthesis